MKSRSIINHNYYVPPSPLPWLAHSTPCLLLELHFHYDPKSPDQFSKLLCFFSLKTALSGWWLGHPSEKSESHLGLLFPIYGKINNVPNHQPVVVYTENSLVNCKFPVSTWTFSWSTWFISTLLSMSQNAVSTPMHHSLNQILIFISQIIFFFNHGLTQQFSPTGIRNI